MARQPTTPTKLLVTYLRPQGWTVALLAVLVLAGIGLQLLNPQILRTFLDGAQEGLPPTELVGLAGLFIGVALIRQILHLGATYVGEMVAWTATNALRADLAHHCLTLDMSFHGEHKPGELIERVDGDVNQLAAFFSQLVIRLGANLLLCAGILLMLGLINGLLGGIIAGVVVAGFLAIRLLNRIAIPRVQALREADAVLFGYLEEWLHGTEVIRSNGAEAYIRNRLYGLLRRRWRRGHESNLITTALNAIPNSVFSLAYIAIFTVGAWHLLDRRISIGTLYVALFYIDMLREPLWQLKRQIEDLQRALASIGRIGQLFSREPTLRQPIHPDPLPTAQHGLQVEVERLSFAYDDEPDNPVLREIHFSLLPGTVLGLLGRTGSGKSTLTKLLLRFHDPSQGAVRLGDGRQQLDLRRVAQADLRRRVGVVTQQVQLFHATVRDNVTLFDPGVDDARIRAALQEVGLGEWLSGLPQGLDSHLSAGDGLSAGEAQLLAFGRILLADPGLIILDEASSRLDPASEARIERAMDRLLRNRTVVIVAHRLATVQRADEILILEEGRILEHGRREALATDAGSHFARLLQTGMEEAIA